MTCHNRHYTEDVWKARRRAG